MSSPILLAGKMRHRKIKLLASSHFPARDTHIFPSEGNALIKAGQRASLSYTPLTSSVSPARTGLLDWTSCCWGWWSYRHLCSRVTLAPSFPGTLGSPHHLLLISNSQLLEYVAHVFCSHSYQEHKMQLKGARWLVSPALTTEWSPIPNVAVSSTFMKVTA